MWISVFCETQYENDFENIFCAKELKYKRRMDKNCKRNQKQELERKTGIFIRNYLFDQSNNTTDFHAPL